ncbi:MAG: glycoside hydrolase family 13 protein [Lachnospiraceae bacterium]|nr:glycoside hydrolase family 13 protein [Lachnospiraceae bacterium]
MNRQALFSDESRNYRSPMEPKCGEEVTIYFRAAREDELMIYLICGSVEIRMLPVKNDRCFTYYSCGLRVRDQAVRYYFEINSESETLYYSKIGVTSQFDLIKYPFLIIPGFTTPDWAKGAIFYQIFVDRFCNGDPTNDVLDREYEYLGKHARAASWDMLPDSLDVANFYGGDLQGVIDKLDYLKWLGVDAIYLNPVFVSPSNHKYDAQDYDHIDPHYGVIVRDEGKVLAETDYDNSHATRYISRVTSHENLEASDALMEKLCDEVHKRGMKIVFDGVFNHCGSFNKWMDRAEIYANAGEHYEKGAYLSGESPYRGYFHFNDQYDWPYNNTYDGWWAMETLPKLNYEQSPELEDYIIGLAQKWLRPPYNIDGWRLDVAADLGRSESYNHRFWERFRAAVKDVNPDALILAEHYGDPSKWLRGNEWDTVMNYDAFMEPVSYFLTGMEKHSDEKNDNLYGNGAWFFQTMLANMSKFGEGSLLTAMNELSNHDHSRFLTRTNRTVGRLATLGSAAAGEGVRRGVLMEAVIIQMTWPGAPTIYYGDEAGLVGWTDPDDRRTYPWGKEDLELIEFHKYLTAFRQRYGCLYTGSLKPLLAGTHLIAYGRFDSHDQVLVIVNNSDGFRKVRVPVWEIGIFGGEQMLREMVSWENSYNVGRSYETVTEDGYLEVELGAGTAEVFSHINSVITEKDEL